MDLDAVRTFVAAADAGQFQQAAAELSLTQQAVSKRVAALEKDLGVRLFIRTPTGVQPTLDGQAFLPHARELLRVEERADASVRRGRRALRIDVVNRRVVSAGLLEDFYRMHPEIELDVVTFDANVGGAIAGVESGTIDASFHAVPPQQHLPDGISAAPVINEPHELLVGPRNRLANARSVTPAQLAGQRIWMPGLHARDEVAAYYDELAAAFGLRIDMVGPVFGNETLLTEIADSARLTTLVGENSRYLWPDRYDLRRIPIRHPAPIYPMSVIWRNDNAHPVLSELLEFLETRRTDLSGTEVWLPTWGHWVPPKFTSLRG
jgi:DNA-binding transcriptional LysR family regulator